MFKEAIQVLVRQLEEKPKATTADLLRAVDLRTLGIAEDAIRQHLKPVQGTPVKEFVFAQQPPVAIWNSTERRFDSVNVERITEAYINSEGRGTFRLKGTDGKTYNLVNTETAINLLHAMEEQEEIIDVILGETDTEENQSR